MPFSGPQKEPCIQSQPTSQQRMRASERKLQHAGAARSGNAKITKYTRVKKQKKRTSSNGTPGLADLHLIGGYTSHHKQTHPVVAQITTATPREVVASSSLRSALRQPRNDDVAISGHSITPAGKRILVLVDDPTMKASKEPMAYRVCAPWSQEAPEEQDAPCRVKERVGINEHSAALRRGNT